MYLLRWALGLFLGLSLPLFSSACGGCGCSPMQSFQGLGLWKYPYVSLGYSSQSWSQYFSSAISGEPFSGHYHLQNLTFRYHQPLSKRWGIGLEQSNVLRFGEHFEEAAQTETFLMGNPQLSAYYSVWRPDDSLCQKQDHALRVQLALTPNLRGPLSEDLAPNLPLLPYLSSNLQLGVDYSFLTEHWLIASQWRSAMVEAFTIAKAKTYIQDGQVLFNRRFDLGAGFELLGGLGAQWTLVHQGGETEPFNWASGLGSASLKYAKTQVQLSLARGMFYGGRATIQDQWALQANLQIQLR